MHTLVAASEVVDIKLMEQIHHATRYDVSDSRLDKNGLFNLYEAIFFPKKVNRNCANCLIDTYYELTYTLSQMAKGIPQPERLKLYKIILPLNGFIRAYGKVDHSTITDELVAKIQVSHPQIYKKHFKKLPVKRVKVIL